MRTGDSDNECLLLPILTTLISLFNSSVNDLRSREHSDVVHACASGHVQMRLIMLVCQTEILICDEVS